MPTKRKQVGRRFRDARLELKYSQQEVADELGLGSRQAIAAWEAGVGMPTATQLGELAVLYGESTDYFVLGIRTIPLSMVKGLEDGKSLTMEKMLDGFKSLIKGMAKR